MGYSFDDELEHGNPLRKGLAEQPKDGGRVTTVLRGMTAPLALCLGKR
jgi:hypothetical protein